MITKQRFKYLIDTGRIVSIWILPVPNQKGWCVDAIIRTPRKPGCQSDVVGGRRRSVGERGVRTFPSIDIAAKFLRDLGAESFTVDLLEPEAEPAMSLGAMVPGFRTADTRFSLGLVANKMPAVANNFPLADDIE